MKSLPLMFKLVIQQLRLYPGRALVTIAGIMASACAVVWVVSGYDALVSQFDENAGKYLGRYDLLLIPQGPPGGMSFVDSGLIHQLQQDAGVLELNPINQSRITLARVPQPGDEEGEATALGLLVGSRPPVNGAPPIDPILVGTPAAEPPYEMEEGRWVDDDAVVVSSAAAKQLKIRVGDEVLITTLANQVRVPVAGIIKQAPDAPSLGGGPGGRGASSGRGRGASQGGPPEQNRTAGDGSRGGGPGARGRRAGGMLPQLVSVGAPEGTSSNTATPKLGLPSAFVQGVATNAIYVRPEMAAKINGFESRPTLLQVVLRDTIDSTQFSEKWKERLSQNRPPLTIVDFSTVRAGMSNSRSVSSQRAQAYAATGFASLAAVFIIFSLLSMGVSERTREFALLRAVAFTRRQIAGIVALESLILAVVGWVGGLIVGYLMILSGSRWMPSLFSSAAELGWTCLGLTGVTVFAGAIGAAVIPAWNATRVQPVEAMSSSTTSAPPAVINSWISWIGLLLAISAPLTVFILPLPDDWRVWCYSIITYPALLIGMVLLTPAIVILTERVFGVVVARLFRLEPRLLTTQMSTNLWRTIGATLALSVGLGLYASTQTWGYSMLQPFLPGPWLPDVLVSFQPRGLDEQGIEAVRQSEGVKTVAPLAIEQALFDWGDSEAPERLRYDNAVVFGVDPAATLKGSNAMIPLDFVEGDRDQVVETISKEQTCIISQDFSVSSGLSIGDTLTLIPPNADSERVTYQIAGVVTLPGWQWVTKFSGVRRHFVRTACMIFAERSQVMNDFHLERPEFCWLDLKPGANLADVEATMQAIAEKHAAGNFEADGLGEVKSYRAFARSTATETVREAITILANDMIWGMSQLPLITLFIMSLAVVNAVIASVRSRQWEFGILRSVGATRTQLVRLVIAETLLIGISASLLSLIFGLIAGWCGVGMAAFGRFGFYQGPPTLIIPWSHLSLGFGIALGLCLIAAAWPALRIGRTEPLRLLTAGRSAH